jgi:hypothetical protein
LADGASEEVISKAIAAKSAAADRRATFWWSVIPAEHSVFKEREDVLNDALSTNNFRADNMSSTEAANPNGLAQGGKKRLILNAFAMNTLSDTKSL